MKKQHRFPTGGNYEPTTANRSDNRRMQFLIAYDVCEPKRLQRLARFLEKHAVRCQKSVFLFRGSTARLKRVVQEAATRLDADVDLLQAWRLAGDETATGLSIGQPLVVFPDSVITGCHGGTPYLLTRKNGRQ